MFKLFKRSEERWKDNEFAKIAFFFPASIISGILILPMTIIALPIALFGPKSQRKVMRFLLTLTHSVSLSFWYFILEYFGLDFEFFLSIDLPPYVEYPMTFFGTYIGWKNTINTLVNETLEKYF